MWRRGLSCPNPRSSRLAPPVEGLEVRPGQVQACSCSSQLLQLGLLAPRPQPTQGPTQASSLARLRSAGGGPVSSCSPETPPTCPQAKGPQQSWKNAGRGLAPGSRPGQEWGQGRSGWARRTPLLLGKQPAWRGWGAPSVSLTQHGTALDQPDSPRPRWTQWGPPGLGRAWSLLRQQVLVGQSPSPAVGEAAQSLVPAGPLPQTHPEADSLSTLWASCCPGGPPTGPGPVGRSHRPKSRDEATPSSQLARETLGAKRTYPSSGASGACPWVSCLPAECGL